VPVLATAFTACAPVPDPGAGLGLAESLALIDQAEVSEIAPGQVAETFALGTRATDVQRDALQARLIGRSVEWEILVYEISLEGGWYEVASQPIPINDPNAVPLVRVWARVLPKGDQDETILQSVKTGDSIKVRGIVQEIRLRTIVAIVPATLAY
jgi:hypothetical protein